MNQGSSELCILNYEDPILRKMASRLQTKYFILVARENYPKVFIWMEKTFYMPMEMKPNLSVM